MTYLFTSFDWNSIVTPVLLALGVGLAGLITWGFSIFQKWLNSKIKDTDLKNALSAITNVVQNIVLSLNQTVVDQLKEDGKFDKEAQERVLKLAIEKSLKQLSSETQEILVANFGPIEEYLETLIESFIRQW